MILLRISRIRRKLFSGGKMTQREAVIQTLERLGGIE